MSETYYAIPLPVMIRLFKHTIGLGAQWAGVDYQRMQANRTWLVVR